MMETLGFSYVGALYLLMLFVPNLLWTRAKPAGYSSSGENRGLQFLEQIGQVGTTCCALIFVDFNLRAWSVWNLWLAVSFLLMLLYELWWGQYFCGPKTLVAFYGNMLGIPVPGAMLPVAAFLFLGIYGRNRWMIISSLVLGVGHIGIHWRHRSEIHRQKEKESP